MDPHKFIITVVDRFKGSDSRQNVVQDFEIQDFWRQFPEFLIKILQLTLIFRISFSAVSITIAYI